MPKKKKNVRPGKKCRELCEKLLKIKVPLTTSLGAVDFLLLKGAGPLSDEQRRFLEVAKKNLGKLFSEIQAFLDFAGK